MAQEIWKDIAGYEGLYQVSNLGRVKSLNNFSGRHKRREKILSPHQTEQGYFRIGLHKNGVQRFRFVHRLVAESFIPNKHKLANTVNHKNKDKADNRADNLEWMTLRDNIRYSSVGPNGNRWGIKNPTARKVRCIETGDIFECGSDASRWVGMRECAVISSIRNGCRAGGYHWEYAD